MGAVKPKTKTKNIKLNILYTVQDARLNLAKQITVQCEVYTFETQFAFINVSGTFRVPSSGSLYANARNAFEYVQMCKTQAHLKLFLSLRQDLRIGRLDVH